jgi:hypothetical protein
MKEVKRSVRFEATVTVVDADDAEVVADQSASFATKAEAAAWIASFGTITRVVRQEV